MDFLDIPNTIIKEVKGHRESIERSILNGVSKDYESYKMQVAQVAAYLAVEELVVKLVRQANGDS